MAINRANRYLQEIIDILDLHRTKYKTDAEARSRLTSGDNEWIDGEILHCITDARYFLSNYYAIRTESEGFQGLYPMFDSQEILFEELRKLEKKHGKVRAMVDKARRMGYTTYMVGEMLHKTIFWKHTDSIIVSQDEKGAKYNMGMYESAFSFLPWWMAPRVNLHQTGALYNFDEPDENLRVSRPGLKSWVYADNANRPSGVGRGQGYRRALLDELAFWKNASQLSKALLRTFNASDGFYVMGSTGNGRNNPWHNLWRRAEAGSIDWHPIFIPFYRRPKTYSLPISKGEVFVLSSEEEEMRKQIILKDNYQITDETFNWMRKTKEEFIATDGDDKMFSQEFPSTAEESFQSSAITAFPRGIINRYTKLTINPKWLGEISYDFAKGQPVLHMRDVSPNEEVLYPERENRFHVWEKPIRGEVYCVGVDVSLGNDGGDYSCCQVVKLSQGHQLDEEVAVWHGYIDPSGLAEIVFAICWLYNEAMAAVEVNSMGMVTNTDLIRKLEYENIYRFKRMDRVKHFMTDIIGWWTDYKSKRALMAKMSKALIDNQIVIRDRFTMDEFNDFTEDGAEGEGAHDDFVMSIMIAYYCGHEGEESQRQQAKNKQAPPNSNLFKVKDRWGTIIAQTTSMNEAQRTAKAHPGSTIERTAGATGFIQLGDKRFKVPIDNQNSDVAVYEKNRTAAKMMDEGFEAEKLTPDAIAEFESEQEELENDPDYWKFC